jgi:hypothetical protein
LVIGSDTTLAKTYIDFVNDYADSLYAISSSDVEVPALHTFADFYSFMVPISVRSGSIFALDSAEKVQVVDFAESGYPIAIAAQNILHLVYGEYYDRIPEEIASSKKANTKKQKEQKQNTNPNKKIVDKVHKFSVYPNPVNNTATISYTISTDCKTAEIIIYNLLGKKVGNIPISQKGASELQFNNNLTGKGVYLFNLMVDGVIIDHKKVVVIGE